MNDLVNKESGESHSHSLIRSRFTFDESEDFPIFNGWYDPTYRYWNGWSNPYFDKPTRDSFLAYQKSFVGQIIDEVDKEFFDYLILIHLYGCPVLRRFSQYSCG